MEKLREKQQKLSVTILFFEQFLSNKLDKNFGLLKEFRNQLVDSKDKIF